MTTRERNVQFEQLRQEAVAAHAEVARKYQQVLAALRGRLGRTARARFAKEAEVFRLLAEGYRVTIAEIDLGLSGYRISYAKPRIRAAA